MGVRTDRRIAIGMAVLWPFVAVLVFGLMETLGGATVVVVLIAWTLAFLVMAALSMRRSRPVVEADAGPPAAESLSLGLEDPEQTARLARADRETERLRISEPTQTSIGPYHLP